FNTNNEVKSSSYSEIKFQDSNINAMAAFAFSSNNLGSPQRAFSPIRFSKEKEKFSPSLGRKNSFTQHSYNNKINSEDYESFKQDYSNFLLDEESSSENSSSSDEAEWNDEDQKRFNQLSLDYDSIALHIYNYSMASPSLRPSKSKTRRPSDNLFSKESKLSSLSHDRVTFYSQRTGCLKAKKFETLNFYNTVASQKKLNTPVSEDKTLNNEESGELFQQLEVNSQALKSSLLDEPHAHIRHVLQSGPFWLDIQNPTKTEITTYCKLFGIHPLTGEDIQTEETREKCESFPNYFYNSIRTFDSDPYSYTYLYPITVNIIVFRDCILTFHYKPIFHVSNVLKRIEQLQVYDLELTPDWINYALIDDICDSFMPLLRFIESEVEAIDDLVLTLKESDQGDLLRKIGVSRKKVLLLLRLLQDKGGVLKTIIKKSSELIVGGETNLYLSDIQDHVITMCQKLIHIEKTLARSHSNYLAQISIEITQASNRTNDVVMKMTALASILIPLNIVTGLWGMNVKVPGQDEDSLNWFFGIVGFMVLLASFTFWIVKKQELFD
ncbi:CorA metal ion transporter, partial [Clydaea vesicula]